MVTPHAAGSATAVTVNRPLKDSQAGIVLANRRQQARRQRQLYFGNREAVVARASKMCRRSIPAPIIAPPRTIPSFLMKSGVTPMSAAACRIGAEP
jgi:hypothetical protein